MSDAAVASAPAVLRVVLFGLPGAGKSSLLAALPHVAESQPHLLNGRIADPSPNLVALPRAIEHGPPAGQEEVVPYSFRYEPDGAHVPRGAVVFDPAGPAAEALVHDPDAGGPLAHEMRHADAVVLAVDASAPAEDLDAVFAEFDGFLRGMERRRGDHTDVGGLPVFLVLTKCDRLAGPGETTADWLEHIEERKREVADRFHDFLAARDAPNQPPGFGRLHLHLWATAVRRPPLAGAAAAPNDPYGVAELFRQCLRDAAAYREQRERSARQLFRMTLAGAAALLTLLAATATMVLADAFRREPSGLEMRVESLRRAEPAAPADRLRGAPDQLRADLVDWQGVRDAPDFGALPPDLQSYVEDRLAELETYIPWLESLEQAPRPRDALTEEDLRALRANLNGPLAPPRADWGPTEAGQLWCEAATEAKTLLASVAAVRRWYQDAYKEGDDLWLSAGRTKSGPSWNGWASAVGAWLSRTEKPPDAEPDKPLRTGLPLIYADVRDFPSVASARAQWEGVRSRLGRLRDQASALGMIEGLKDKPALLVLPADVTLAKTDELFQKLRAAYPDYETTFIRAPGLPPEAASELAGRARANYQLALEPARALVRTRLGDGLPADAAPRDADTPERWAQVREWLNDPKELAGWRRLAVALARLADPESGDPVDALADFLDRKSFPLELNGFALVVPDALDVKPKPEEPLKVYHASAGAAEAARLFRPIGDGVRVEMRPSLEYRFAAADPDLKLECAPGDGLYAELPLLGGGTLRWDRSRSRLYAFEALRKEPVLLEAGQAPAAGRPAEGVRLKVRPENGVPKVPDLMPQVDVK